MDSLVWNAVYHSMNEKKLKTFNIFQHPGFRNDVYKHFKKCADKDEFARELRRSLFYYFCGKCEWEVIISAWCGGRDTEDIKVDVYWQVMNNWDIFLDYVWNKRKGKAGKGLKYEPQWDFDTHETLMVKKALALKLLRDILKNEDKPRMEVMIEMIERGIPERIVTQQSSGWPVTRYVKDNEVYWHLNEGDVPQGERDGTRKEV